MRGARDTLLEARRGKMASEEDTISAKIAGVLNLPSWGLRYCRD